MLRALQLDSNETSTRLNADELAFVMEVCDAMKCNCDASQPAQPIFVTRLYNESNKTCIPLFWTINSEKKIQLRSEL